MEIWPVLQHQAGGNQTLFFHSNGDWCAATEFRFITPLTGVKLGLFYLIKNNNHTLDTILSFDSLLYLLILIINLKDCKNVIDYSTYITIIKIWKNLQAEVDYWLFVWLNSFASFRKFFEEKLKGSNGLFGLLFFKVKVNGYDKILDFLMVKLNL